MSLQIIGEVVDGTLVLVVCQWFARCTREAAGVVEHPVLGHVPCCQECADSLDMTVLPAEWVLDA